MKAAIGIGDIDQAGHQEHLFHDLVGALDDQQPDQDGADRHGNVFADAEDLQAGGDAGELGDGIAHVGQKQGDHDVEGDLDAEGFADQVRQPLAGDRPHAGAHLLDDDQRDGGGDHHPEERIAEVGRRPANRW